jgi:uncharacterized protein (TIGR00369 family)
MTHDEIIALMNQHRPACVQTLKGEVLSFSEEKSELSMQFEPGLNCCHTVDIVQGGYITAMLDAAMAHAVLGVEKFQVQLSSIDINVSFLRPTRAGKYIAVGSIVKLGKNIGYLKAELFNAQGELTASATSSAYLTRKIEKKSVANPPAQGFGL